MSRVLARSLTLLERNFEEIICACLLLVMGALVFLQVIMRYVFSDPLSWSDEIAIYCMVWSVYIGGSLAVRERVHIRVLNGILAFRGPVRLALVIFSDALWAAANILLVWQGMVLELSFWEQPYISPALGIDQKWPYLIVPLGFALMTLRLGQIYYRWLVHGNSILYVKVNETD